MKTAISLPDPVFRAGDALAKKLGITRSELYARALEDYVAKHRSVDVTKRLDALYAQEESRIDRGLLAAEVRAMPKERW